ncbi:MAG TPA: Fe-S cluster assembly protein SufD [Verrucomicrobiota bacterium]|jgi:Fe-S cluster assembly protein SufD|nr:Fe-S cluster assembly protein SufD [Verrucomicrobiota bacterium]HQL79587.1 Fe-S cluster assembly protein SufD [Verrucomicrobiota bacterium]
MKDTDQYLETFERFEAQARQPAWMAPLRKAGIARFAELGFPTLQQEDWRFTNVAPIASLPFKPVLHASRDGLGPDRIAQLTFGRLAAHRLVFIDGHYAAALSAPGPQPGGVVIRSLAAALADHAGLVRGHLAQHSRTDDDAFAALNSAFFQDGGFVYVPAGRQTESPVHLLFISTAKEPGATAQPRNLVIAEKGARATVLESYVSLAEGPHFTNPVTELALGEGAAIEHVKFQDESQNAFHIAALRAHLGRSSNLISHSIATGARLSRNTIHTALAGEGVECVLNGLYLTRGEQLADHHMVVEHAQPHCNSHEYFNGILDGRSKGVFHGRILVRPAAQKTDAKQTNKNLLLSDEATVDTKPQLEIYADDVKCTHGATVGQLNDESIFYLRARGIGAETARRMLIHAFAGEIIERVQLAPAREELDKLVWERLEQNPHVGKQQRV